MTQKRKDWKSFDEQLAILKARGLTVDNGYEQKALHYLEKVGYYRLSGYFYPFRVPDGSSNRKDDFIAGSRFEDVIKLYVFDKRLRLLVLDALERIELALRVDVAYLLGQRDKYAYEKPECLHGSFTKKVHPKTGKTQHEEWLEKYHGFVRRSRREPFVKHHLDHYEKLPIWAAIEIWDFGALSKLFSGMKQEDKQVIALKYADVDAAAFADWLKGLNFVRNVSAHHSRLWNINVLDRAPVWQKDEQWARQNNARVFYYLCIMQQMLRTISPNSTWSIRLFELLQGFPTVSNGCIRLEDMGWTKQVSQWELWQ